MFKEFLEDIKKFGDFIYTSLEGRSVEEVTGYLPVAKLGLGGRAYATITGSPVILDLSTGDMIPGTKTEFLETIQYNLTALYVSHSTNQPNDIHPAT